MNGIGDLVSKTQEFVTALASAPQPEDRVFVRNARPFGIYGCVVGLVVSLPLAIYLKDSITSGAIVLGLTTIAQQFGAQRSRDAQAKIAAATEDKKTITGAATIDKQAAAVAAGGQP